MGYGQKVVIIGAGISGLACAYRLKQLGVHPLVLEATGRAGGLIQTIRRDGFLFETGPQCPRFPPPLWELVRGLGLENEFAPGDPRSKRYIVKHGCLHAAPFSPAGFIASRLVDWRAKFRVFAEVFGRSTPPAHEESLAEFVSRKVGMEFLDYLVDPLVSSIFLGDPSQMGMDSAFPALAQWERNQGSIVRGAIRAKAAASAQSRPGLARGVLLRSIPGNLRVTDRLPSLGSFKRGMGILPERLAEELRDNIRYGQRIAFARPAPGGISTGGWELHLPGVGPVSAESLVVAVPAYVAAGLLERTAPNLASLLNSIEYAPVFEVSSVYERSQISHRLDGFGFMVPRREGLKTICTFWNSSLFAGVAPKGKVLLTSFARTEADDDLLIGSNEGAAQAIEAENAAILGITGNSVDHLVWRNGRALPLYTVGHARRVSEIASELRTIPHLHVAGNFLKGRSIGDCVEVAFRVADEVYRHSRE